MDEAKVCKPNEADTVSCADRDIHDRNNTSAHTERRSSASKAKNAKKETEIKLGKHSYATIAKSNKIANAKKSKPNQSNLGKHRYVFNAQQSDETLAQVKQVSCTKAQ